MKLSVNYSEALITLLRIPAVEIDAIEWVDKLELGLIAQRRAEFPGLPFHFHPGRMQTGKNWRSRLLDYLQACPESPFVSIHLAPLPTLWTNARINRGWVLPGPIPALAIWRFIRMVNSLKQQVEPPVILENMPSLHPKRYRFESDPAVIAKVLDETQTDLLLDLAHARIAARARGISSQEYITALPLERTQQIHLAGVREGPDGWLYDAHESLMEEDYQLLEWTLERTKPQLLTLEYFREDPQALLSQLSRLQCYR